MYHTENEKSSIMEHLNRFFPRGAQAAPARLFERAIDFFPADGTIQADGRCRRAGSSGGISRIYADIIDLFSIIPPGDGRSKNERKSIFHPRRRQRTRRARSAASSRSFLAAEDLFSFIQARDMVAFKTHFGEEGTQGFVRPLHFKMMGRPGQKEAGPAVPDRYGHPVHAACATRPSAISSWPSATASASRIPGCR